MMSPTTRVFKWLVGIVVTGTNDAPIATFNAAQAVNEDAAPITDTLTATDADVRCITFTLDAPIAGISLAGADWTFDATHAHYQSLALNALLVLTVNYTVTDLEARLAILRYHRDRCK